MAAKSDRLAAIYDELDKAFGDYRATKETFVDAKVRYESSRERFSGIRKLAADMLTTSQWSAWVEKHPAAKYVGMPIGNAIKETLETNANEWAWTYVSETDPTKKHYWPFMGVERIAEVLERGGYEFRSLTPLREVNAALMKLDGVTKKGGLYKIATADRILENTQELIENAMRDVEAGAAAARAAARTPPQLAESVVVVGDRHIEWDEPTPPKSEEEPDDDEVPF